MDDPILTPLKGYNEVYKDKHLENTSEYFEELAKKANVDVNSNRETVAKYKNKLSKIVNLNKQLNKYKTIKILFIVGMIVFAILGFIFAWAGSDTTTVWAIIFFVLALATLIAFLIVYFVKIKKEQLRLQAEISKLQKEADNLKDEAYKQMAPLNALFDYGISTSLLTKTVPLIKMDKILDHHKLEELLSYGLTENKYVNSSTVMVQSGSVLGNPFALIKTYDQTWHNRVYTGSITIHWTTTVKTKDGYQTHHHTQVLTASVTKPEPLYGYETRLYFGSDAAPNLTFSRHPSSASSMDEKSRAKYVKSQSKKLNKKAEKAIKTASNYTRLSNDEFETIFGGTDRDNEVEFRLMYTPLAQQNVLDILTNQQPYGDDFSQYKEKKLNTIISAHSQHFDYDDNPLRYIGFDYDYMKNYFINYNAEFFKAFYFEIAPLMAVPLYQQTKAHSYIYQDDYESNLTSFEHERMANSFNVKCFEPKGADTPTIIKTKFASKNESFDVVDVNAYAFSAFKRVTYIPRHGGDGRTHLVPVYWIEYQKVTSQSSLNIEEKESSRVEFNNLRRNDSFRNLMNTVSNTYTYNKGLFAFTGNRTTHEFNERVNQLFTDNKKDQLKKTIVDTAILAALLLDEENEVKDKHSESLDKMDKIDNALKDSSVEAEEKEVDANEIVDEDEDVEEDEE